MGSEPRSGRSPMSTREPSFVWGVSWCLLGVALMTIEQGLGCALAAFGSAILLGVKRPGARAAMAGTLLGTLAVCTAVFWFRFGMADGLDMAANGLVGIGVACAMAYAVSSESKTTVLASVTTLVAAGLLLAISEAEAIAAGTTLSATVNSVLSVFTTAETSLSTRAQIGALVPILNLVWPIAFLLDALVWSALSYVGARMALAKTGRKPAKANLFSNFEMPLWVVGILLAGVVAIVAANTLSWWGDILRMVGANLAMVARVGLAVQGTALLSWLMAKNKVWVPLRVLAFVLCAYLEISFFVMSVVGLVDVWANFRHLPHGASSSASETTK